MRKSMTALIVVSAMIVLNGAAFAENLPAKTANTAKGVALVDGAGMTLYTFDRDSGNASNCNGTCANNWPPFQAPADATPPTDWSVVTRGDGGRQWAHKGKPLYTFYKDGKAGDANGDGVNNVWHIATP